MRTTAALLVSLGLIASLAACSSAADDTTAAACTPTASGTASDAVTVTGDFGALPTVKIDAPLTTETTERSVVIKGDGDVAESGNDVTINYSLYSGTTGDAIVESAYDETSPQTIPLSDDLLAGFSKTLECSTAGSRVVGVIATADGYDADTLTSAGLAADETVVIVADVISTEVPAAVIPPLEKADGADQPLPDGFPAIDVALADDGTPTVTLPGGDAPTDLQIAVLKKGTGATVGTAVDVVVNYQGLNWATGEIFDQSWGTGSTASFNTSALIAGFTQAIEGQTVGSQILVVIPPALAYGEASDSNTAELAGQTLVFVIDILGLA